MLRVPDGHGLEAERRSRKYRFTANVIASIVVAADLGCLVGGPVAAGLLYRALGGKAYLMGMHVTIAVIITVNFLLIRLSRDSYANPMGRGQDSDQGVVFEFTIAALLMFATVWQLGLGPFFSPPLALFYTAICAVLLFVSRYVVRQIVWHLVQAGYIGQRIIIYGAEEQTSERVLRLLDIERLPYLSIVGIADGRTSRVNVPASWKVPFIGGMPALLERVSRGDVDMVIIALPMISQKRLDEITESLQRISVDICLMPREAMDLSTQYSMRFIGSLPLFALWQRPIRDLNHIVKALEDRILAAVGLILLSPVFLLTAIAIRLGSKGPVLFRQRRFGFNNVEIDVLKFRSMYSDRGDVTGGARTTPGDARVTPVGRFIRRTSIDELPQLWNVLIGEMSIVGPRPHATMMMVGDSYYFDAVRNYAARHRVKPGITGLAQVRGLRGEIDSIERAKRRVELDFYYIENWSLMLDVRIILETIFKLPWDKRAY